MPEAPSEKHNRIAAEIGLTIMDEFDPIDRIIILESLVAAIIGMMPFEKELAAQAMDDTIDMLCQGAKNRIKARKK